MNMNFHITFVGKDLKYFNSLEERFIEDYKEFEFEFTTIQDIEKKGAKDIFLEIHSKKSKIIYIDFSTDEAEAFSLCKFLNKNNETRLVSTVGLFSYRHNMDLIKKAINVELRLFHYKSMEIDDVIYHPISLLDVNLAHTQTYTSCKDFKDIEMLQPVRIGFIEDNHFHIETNSYLNVGEIIDLNTHPLIDIMPSTKAFVAKFYEQDLYYNKRFAYDLEFIYIDNDYFTATNQRWLLYKDLKKHPEKMDELDKHVREELFEDMNKRKRSYRPIRNQIDAWLSQRANQGFPKKLKIMVVGLDLQFMKNTEGKIEDFPYTINVQTTLIDDMYQIKRSMPHLIVFNYDEAVNNEKKLDQMITKINSISKYNPYILVFDHHNKDVMKRFPNNHIMVYTGLVSLDEIRKMAKLVDDKLNITNGDLKVFPSSHSDDSLMLVKRNISIKAMTESVAYFESKTKIPHWTVFIVETPVPMLLTIVPHKDDGEFKNTPNLYRALINGVGMKEKAKLRTLINQALGMTK